MSFLWNDACPVIRDHRDKTAISQRKLSVWFALYIGGALNISVWLQSLHAITPPYWHSILSFVLIGLCVLSFTLCLLQMAAWLGNISYRLWASILLLFSAAAAYYMHFFHVVIGYGIMRAVLTTEFDLSQESIGTNFSWWIMATTAFPLWVLWRVRITHNTWQRLPHLLQWRIPIAELLCLLLVIYGSTQGLKKIDQWGTQAQQMANSAGVMAHRYLPSNWIAGLGMVAYHHFAQYGVQQPLFSPAQAFQYQADPDQDPLTIIFIIGESLRTDHLALYGYPRNTTPWLSQETNLIALPGQSCDTATYLSLRCMFVRDGANTNDPDRTPTEQNIFQTLRTLGFSIDLFAMQSEIWFYNSVDANDYLLREMIAAAPGNEGKPIDDMLLLPLLAQSLNQHPQGKHLVILHTKGSHYQYSQRYPRSFAYYTPECLDIDDNCSKAQLINAYDNSVRYTDLFIKRVIDQVRDRHAIVFYSADHGESISEGHHFHATPKAFAPPEQRTVPILVWVSTQFLNTHTGQRTQHQLHTLQQTKKIVRHETLFDSILGCIGYTSTQLDPTQNQSWCQ
jgi:KDO II ethanolaminephosphotransferase